MEAEYWKKKWAIGDIGFHQARVEPLLEKYFSKRTPEAVFVPLCGKSKDLLWLAQQGWTVIGVEASPIACRSFFEESGMAHEEQSEGNFTLYKAPGITLWCGDFFKLPESAISGVTTLYDRAALIALPSDLRPKYANHMKRLFGPEKSIKGLLLALEYPQERVQGPPFSVEASEIHRLYDGFLAVREVERDEDTVLPAKNQKFSGVRVFETSYWLESAS